MNADREVSRHYSRGNLSSRLNAVLTEDGVDPERPSIEVVYFHSGELLAIKWRNFKAHLKVRVPPEGDVRQAG